MYYTELIQKFWHFNEKVEIGTTAIAMYLYLLKLANDSNGYVITISDVVLSKTLGITRKTVKTTKQKLHKIGVIEYVTRTGISGSYRIIVDYPFWEADTKFVESEKSKLAKVQTREKANKTLLKSYYKKNIEKNTAEKENNSGIKQKTNNLDEKVFEKPKRPTFEEFLEYAQTLEGFVTPLYDELSKKYHFWEKNGWRSNSNRPITNWKLSLKQILPYMCNNVNNETNQVVSISTIKIPEELESR